MFKFIKRVCALLIFLLIFYQVLVIRHNVHRVLAYKPMVEKTLAENDTKANVDLVLAMIYTETKGGEADVMQSSESSSGKKDSITDSQSSIEHGVSLLSHNLSLAEEAGVDSWTAVQAYNFGTAYIDYVADHGGQNTIPLATTYSKTVVAPSLGNTSGQTYFYYHPLALISGGKLYKNGGNIYYS
ncbi:lysozyme family protein, partial [Streptococcus dysgalactiae]